MSFRTVEITGPAELHVKSGLLIIEKEMPGGAEVNNSDLSKQKKKKKKETEVKKISVPLEDINTIVCMGAAIRISTMAMAQICHHKITMAMLDEKYQPAGILNAYEANARQALIMRKQVYMDEQRNDRLWRKIVRRKILNQSDALEELGLPGSERVREYGELALTSSELDSIEAAAAKAYFRVLCPDVNRREETPMNSRLNYGYSIIRNSIIRSLVSAGLLPAFGLHHKNLYNANNLADDLIEPYRPCVDLLAFRMGDGKIQLTREERRQLAMALQLAVSMNGQKLSVIQAIDLEVGELRKYIIEECDSVCLPHILHMEFIKQIKE